MLLTEDKKKLEAYVDKLIEDLMTEITRVKKTGIYGKQLIEKAIGITVSKLTPESKMILSSAYNMMTEHTLSEEYFTDSVHKAEFYSSDILKDITNKFNFDVPKKIDYKSNNLEVNKMIASGTVAIIGGIVSIKLKSWIPIGVAALIVCIMLFLLKDSSKSSLSNVDTVINDYFDVVKKSLMTWIDSLESYYDNRVAQIREKRLSYV